MRMTQSPSHEFAFLSFEKHDLLELHRALLGRFLMQNRLRHEQGLEEIDYPILLGRLEELLGYTDEESHRLFHRVEAELWEYSWYTYTEEWAWFRARQDVLQSLLDKGIEEKPEEFLIENLTESFYDDRFAGYAAEIDMSAEPPKTKKIAPHTKQKKNKTTR